MQSYEQFTLAAARLIAVVAVLVPGAGSAAQGASFAPCDLTFRLNTGRVGTDEGEQIAVAALRRFTGGSNVPYEEGLP